MFVIPKGQAEKEGGLRAYSLSAQHSSFHMFYNNEVNGKTWEVV